jgi:hypothetical protein
VNIFLGAEGLASFEDGFADRFERMLRYTLKYSEDEIETFREAWREMLKTQF